MHKVNVGDIVDVDYSDNMMLIVGRGRVVSLPDGHNDIYYDIQLDSPAYALSFVLLNRDEFKVVK